VANPGLIIFDCDGVLVDSESISCGVLARMLSEEGLPTTLAEARRDFQGLLLADVAAEAQTKLGRPLPADWLAAFERERARVFRRDLQAVQGAAAAIQQIKAAGLAVCVASQGKLQKTQLSLDLTGLRHLFPARTLFSAYQVPRGKPYPDLFLHAAHAMGAQPPDCIVVEDTPSGVVAAVGANMRTFGYAADSDETALRRAGAEIFHSLDELPGLIGLS
jgi:HAD superfamily hydrolase (TIGR01509 family)